MYLNATVAAGLRASGQDHGSQKRPAFPTFSKMKAKEVLPRTFRELKKKPSEEEHCVVGVVDEVSANSRAALPVVRHRTLEPIQSGVVDASGTRRSAPRRGASTQTFSEENRGLPQTVTQAATDSEEEGEGLTR